MGESTEADLQRRFGGVARLYGETALQRFMDARLAVIGVGGVGSWAAEALARSGVGHLTLIDMDHVAESNINRQLPALTSTLGRSKVGVLRERIAQIHPGCITQCVEEMVEPDNLARLVPPAFDFVLDCIDGYRNKAALIAHCRRNRIPLVTAGGAGGRVDPTRIRVSDLSRTLHDPLLAKTRKLLRRDYGFSSNPKRRFDVAAVWSDEQPAVNSACHNQGGLNCGGFGSAAAVTASFGMATAAHALRKLAAD